MVAARLIDLSSEGRQHVDRYELVAEIASGGMATVFLARLSGVGGFQRFVAIKRLHPHLATEQEFVDMFLDEARLAAGIHHPNVVPILEVGASARGYYLVMEYVEGDTLARFLARAATQGQRIPTATVLRIVLDMLLGLHAAHEHKDEMGQPTGLVHRDVSPQNVLVGVDGICRITDFGVARAAQRLSGTRVGQLKGKVAYMAPEQAMGLTDVDRRADVFAAGIVLWEVLAGRRLFKSENEAHTLTRVMSEEIVDVRQLSPEVDEAIALVAMKALERDREKRFQTCAAFAEALERAAQDAKCLVSAKELAQYVSVVIGDEIAQQRDAVRAWLARSEPSQIAVTPGLQGPTSSVSAASISIGKGERSGVTALSSPAARYHQPPPVPTGSRILLFAAIGMFGVVAIAAAIFLALRTRAEPAPAAPVANLPAPLPVTAATPTPPAPSPAETSSTEPLPTASEAPSRPATPESRERSGTSSSTRSGGSVPSRTGGSNVGSKKDELPSNPYR